MSITVRMSIILFVCLAVFACGNRNNSNLKGSNNNFNAVQILSDPNLLKNWENATIKSIKGISDILLKDAGLDTVIVSNIINEIKNKKNEKVINGRKIYGSRKWLLEKLRGYKNTIDTTSCNSMFIVELEKEGEELESEYWILLFNNNNCRFTLTINDDKIVHKKDKVIKKEVFEKLINENYPSAIMTNKCLDKGESLPMANLYLSKFTENNIEVFSFPTFCSGFYDKFLSLN